MKKTLITLTSCASLSIACSDSEPAASADAAAATPATLLQFDSSSLPELGADYVYEGWIIVDDQPITAGRFTVDGQGNTTPSEFELDPAEADAATLYVLTIEPATGDDPAPSSTHLLAGPLSQGTASLIASHAAALNTNFETAAGTYILATPTTGDDTLQDRGIWWLDPMAGAASLTLPTLPAGWAYEGWVVGSDGPVSTGRFTDPAVADSDGAGATKGPSGDGPPFPGQDFITPEMLLSNGSTIAVISVEPDPDDSPGPFLIKPLVADPIGAAVAPTAHTMTNNAAATLPTATISIASSGE